MVLKTTWFDNFYKEKWQLYIFLVFLFHDVFRNAVSFHIFFLLFPKFHCMDPTYWLEHVEHYDKIKLYLPVLLSFVSSFQTYTTTIRHNNKKFFFNLTVQLSFPLLELFSSIYFQITLEMKKMIHLHFLEELSHMCVAFEQSIKRLNSYKNK